MKPEIRVKPPGARASRIVAKDHRVISPSYTRAYPLAVERGEDVWIFDADGNRYLDFTSGVGVTVVGHAQPDVNRAASEQMSRFTHICGTDFYYAAQSDLAERLGRIVPGPTAKKVFFTNSGTESIEAALKLARFATGRHRLLAFLGSFHGRTFGSLSLTASKTVQRAGFGPLLPDVTHVPYPNPYRDVFNAGDAEGCAEAVLGYIENYVFRRLAPPTEFAAVVVEPIQGEGGYIVPPPNFLPGLRRLCDRHGILLIVDEVQSGFGRTGRWFAFEHFNIVPDIVCLAKGIANGLPLGAMVAPAKLHRWGPGSHANTFGGNPVACAASLVTIDLIERRYIANARREGARLAGRLDRVVRKFDVVGEHRGIGLMRAVEIVQSKASRRPAPELRNRIVNRCFESGLLLLGCGDSTVRFLPPLTVTAEHVDTAADILEGVLKRP